MSNLYSYPNVLEASRGLLLDVCGSLTRLHTNYVIVGGWVPFIRGGHESLHHPGTKDVDVLLNDEAIAVRPAVEELLRTDYLPSAKHPFQLLRVLNVDGQEMVFNVDLMHPSEEAKKSDMFEDIMELHINEAYDPRKVKMKSIAFPSSLIVFDEGLWSDVAFEATGPLGNRAAINIPLLDEVGLVLSKCDSVSKKKRERDAFDIYLILSGFNGKQTALRLRDMGVQFPQVQAQLNLLRDYVRHPESRFDQNVHMYAPRDWKPSIAPATYVEHLLFV